MSITLISKKRLEDLTVRKVILVAMHVAIRFYNCTFVEFLEWKSKVEKTTNVYYIKSSGMKLSTKN